MLRVTETETSTEHNVSGGEGNLQGPKAARSYRNCRTTIVFASGWHALPPNRKGAQQTLPRALNQRRSRGRRLQRATADAVGLGTTADSVGERTTTDAVRQ